MKSQSHISTLFLLLALIFPFVTASPRDFFGLESESQPTSNPTQDHRQATRNKILTRTRVRETREHIHQAQKRWSPSLKTKRDGGSPVHPALRPRASAVRRSVVYATCDGGLGLNGWARYPAWELEFDDIPGAALNVGSEEQCVSSCLDYGSACAGVQYLPSNDGPQCQLKAPAIHTGKFSNDTEEATSPGAVLSLVGGCDAWAGTVPAEMDAVCCGP